MSPDPKTATTVLRSSKDFQSSPINMQVSMSETTHNNKTAIVYCEGNFAEVDGKTANGLVRHSETYEVLAVIDSKYEGQDSGQILDGVANQIPVLRNLHQVKECQKILPQTLIYGMAPSSGTLSKDDRKVILDAISLGMNIVIGLHEYLSDDFEIANAASASNVTICDIRKPKASKDLRLFDGTVASVPALRIALLGTDCAIGKRTTATLLTKALNDIGIRTVLIGTGQTGLMQGAKYGVAMDAIPPQYCCGELEGAIVAASESEDPKVIIVEGQGALSHPAFCTSAFILRGSQPDAVILQHAPKRVHRCDFPDLPMPSPESEIQLIEAFSDTKVIGLTINHEGMSEIELGACIAAYSRSLDLPVTDPLSRPVSQLLNMVMTAYSGLRYTASTGAV